MKKTLRFSIAALLVVLAVGIMSFTAGKNAAAKETSPKETKKLVSVTYYYTPGAGGITNPARWSNSGTPCDNGNAQLCAITFNTDTYPLDANGKPSSTVLNHVSTNLVTGGTTPNSYTIVSGTITIILKS